MVQNDSRDAEINLTVRLDESKMPEAISWQATDYQGEGKRDAEAFTLSIWDKKDKTSMSIDLWTKAMTVPEMSLFYYQKFLKMSETFERSTGFKDIAKDIREFAENFSKSIEKELGENNKN